MAVDIEKIKVLGRELLIAIGEDPDRDGLKETPDRFARWWKEFIEYQPGKVETAFAIGNVDEIVAVRGIEVWSLCEHHLLPFRARVTIGYIPNEKVLGLSKFGRIAFAAAHRLQVQERLVQNIADGISAATKSEDIAVIADGEHLCMTMRGVRTPASMRTSVMRGRFRANPEARAEFLSLVNKD